MVFLEPFLNPEDNILRQPISINRPIIHPVKRARLETNAADRTGTKRASWNRGHLSCLIGSSERLLRGVERR